MHFIHFQKLPIFFYSTEDGLLGFIPQLSVSVMFKKGKKKSITIALLFSASVSVLHWNVMFL